MKSPLPTLPLACLLAAWAIGPAVAQESKPSSPTLPPAVGSQLQDLLGGVLKPANPNAAVPSTRFTPAGKALFLEEMLGKLTLEPQQKQQFRQYVEEVMRIVELAYEKNGFEKNDLGVAIGGLLETSYEMDQGLFKLGAESPAEEEANKKKTRATIRQVQQAVGATPGFKALSDRNKQLAYEACTFLTGHLAVSWQQAGKDEEKLKAVRQLARQQLVGLFRLDPAGITRTASGEFAPRGKGVAPTAPAPRPEGIKSGSTPPPSGGGQPGPRIPSTGGATSGSTAPGALARGGELKPGIYTGLQMTGKEVRHRYRLYLYPNGQYRMLDEQGKQLNSSVRLEYQYDPRTGLLDLASGIQYNMRNNRRDPDDDLCVFGKDKEGKPFVFARSNRGYGYATTLLRYSGPVDKPSPQEEAIAKAEAEAEAKRYKWVVPAGQGLKPAQIAGVLFNHDVKQFYNGSGLSVSSDYDLYLLLQDGTLYNGLPVAPDEMDVSRSRRQEPEKWGRWKRQGNTYLAAWPDAPGQFKPLKGRLMSAAPRGTRLSGRFGAGEASGSILGSSYRLWGVTFGPDGRFLKDQRGGYGSSITAQNSGMPHISSTYDDKGSATSATGDNFVVGSSKKKVPTGDRSGRYTVDGYVLTLQFDDGHVMRLPFFFGNTEQTSLWFEGAMMSLDKDKGQGRK